jgi:HAD superfamily hydrolase (TIGR01459 family)
MIEPGLEHRFIGGLRDLGSAYDLILCDVWGVVHDGVQAFPAAAAALARFRAGGGTVVLITNAPRPARPIMHQLDEFGVPRDAYDGTVTSGDVTLALMAERGAAPVHHIGPRRDDSLFEELARLVPVVPRRVGLEEAAYVLCTGLFDDEAETPEDYDPALELMRRRALALVCANPDLVVHRGDRLVYCAGAIAKRYEAHGGTAIYAGKPHPPIYDAALKAAARLRGRPVERSRVLAIGDAMRTDIAGAAAVGVDALFVTSGIHRDELNGADGRLDRARYAQFAGEGPGRPTAAICDLVW